MMKRICRRLLSLAMILSLTMSLFSMAALAAEGEEHTHNAGGWSCTQSEGELSLTCELDAHTHGDGCYADGAPHLTCEEEHEHGEGCFTPGEPQPTCAQSEHTHNDRCYTRAQGAWTCTPPADEGGQEHTHAYENGLCACGEIDPDHTHDYADGYCTICEEPEPDPEPMPNALCTCTERCAEGAPNQDCPLCAVDLSLCGVEAPSDGPLVLTESTTVSGVSTPIVIGADLTLTLDSVTIDGLEAGESAISIAPGVTAAIVVNGSCALTGGEGGAGIWVPADAVLNLSGSGSLTAVGNGGTDTNSSGAGIGGAGSAGDSGEIQIDGLSSLTALGYGLHACGIGSAWNGSSAAITITNTTIDRAAGGHEASALATKYGTNDPEGGAAIGGGGKGKSCGDITITNSVIHSAHGGSKATAIGGTCWASCGTITITGSTLEDVVGGSSSAGIGVARVTTNFGNGSAWGASADIIIRDCNINVTGGEYGAAIGTGYNGNSIGDQGKDILARTTITIENSQIHAVGGNGGAAIGGGYKGWNAAITITGGTVYAQGGVLSDKKIRTENGASAIGTGANGSGVFAGGVIAIGGGADVTAVSNGGKWAIDLSCDVSGVENAYQNMFLTQDVQNTASGDLARNPADDCDMVAYTQPYTILMNGKTVTVPGDFLCAAVTTGGPGTFRTTTADGTLSFSHYDEAANQAGYAGKESAEALGEASVEMGAGSELASHSYLYVALRGHETEQPGPDPDPDPTPSVVLPPDSTPTPTPGPTTDLPEEEPPLADIPEEEPPLTETPVTDADPAPALEEIPEEEPPLAGVPTAQAPKTGDGFMVWLVLAALSGLGLAVLSLPMGKDRNRTR